MRVSDLSRRSGVPVPTIKFYLREKLLPPGELTGRNQAVYGEEHLQRLQMIRAFSTIGRLGLTSVRELLTTIEDEQLPPAAVYATLNEVLARLREPVSGEVPGMDKELADVDRIAEAQGWQVQPGSATRVHLATVLSTMRRISDSSVMDCLDDYARATDRLVQCEIDRLPLDNTDRVAAIAHSLLLGEAYAAIRRLAQEHHVGRRCDAAATWSAGN